MGGVRVVNENVRSGFMVTWHGIGVSGFRWAVRALLDYQCSVSAYVFVDIDGRTEGVMVEGEMDTMKDG